MKKIIAIIAILTSATSFAHTASTSWEVLEKDPTIRIAAPTVFMGSSVDYMSVCADGANLRTIKPVKQCETIYVGHNDRPTTVCKGEKHLSTPINYTRSSWDCKFVGGGDNGQRVCEDKVISGTYPLNVNVAIYKIVSLKNGTEKFLFNKAYSVPNCR